MLKTIFALIITLNFCELFAQDVLVLENETRVYGKIIKADSNRVVYLNSDNVSGPQYVYGRKHLKRIIYSDSTIVNYPDKYTQIAVGIGTTYSNKTRSKIYNSAGIYAIENILFSSVLLIRGKAAGIRMELGTGNLKENLKWYKDSNYWINSETESDNVDSRTYYANLQGRLNQRKDGINPFIYLSVGYESYNNKGYHVSGSLTKAGIGVQYRWKKRFLFETDIAYATWKQKLPEFPLHTFKDERVKYILQHISTGLSVFYILSEKYN